MCRNGGRLVSGARSGAVLPLVLGLLLAVTFLLTSLLQMPGEIRRAAFRQLQEQQRIYDAESSLEACLSGLPGGFFGRAPWNVDLPEVGWERLGPWSDLSAPVLSLVPGNADRRIHVLAGNTCDSACGLMDSYETRLKIYESFRQELNSEITMAKPPHELRIKSGNRRFFGRLRSMSLWVQDGDLTLDLEGNTSSCRFIVDGSVELRGQSIFDTLRVYARGPLALHGKVRVRWLEAFSEDHIEISRGVAFSGIAVARHGVLFPDGAGKVEFRYPSFTMSLEGSSENFTEPVSDSMLVPTLIPGKLKSFEWRMR